MSSRRKLRLVLGSVLMVTFLVVLVGMFLPLFGGQNFLNYMDNLYNSISKASASYIPGLVQEVEESAAGVVTLELAFDRSTDADQAASLLAARGIVRSVSGSQVTVETDLALLLGRALEDSESLYHNREQELSDRSGVSGSLALFTWWTVLSAAEKDLNHQKLFKEAQLTAKVKTKAVECAYNYRGIEPRPIAEKWPIVLFSLVFYVVYTVWYGYAVMFLFEGLGYRLEH